MRYLGSSFVSILLGQQTVLIMMMFLWKHGSGFTIPSSTSSRRNIEVQSPTTAESTSALFAGNKKFSAREVRSSESYYQEEQEKTREIHSSDSYASSHDGLFGDHPGDNSMIPVDRTPYQPPSPAAFSEMFPSSPTVNPFGDSTTSATTRGFQSSESYSRDFFNQTTSASGINNYRLEDGIDESHISSMAGGGQRNESPAFFRQTLPSTSTTPAAGESKKSNNKANDDNDAVTGGNTAYVESLIRNLQVELDKYKLTQRPNFEQEAYRILELIELYAFDADTVTKVKGLVEKVGLTVPSTKKKSMPAVTSTKPNDPKNPFGTTTADLKWREADARKQWSELQDLQKSASNDSTFTANAATVPDNKSVNKGFNNVVSPRNPIGGSSSESKSSSSTYPQNKNNVDKNLVEASAMVSEFIAKAGGASNFDGKALGIGGLDAVLSQIKRRVWIPLSAPPVLLQELSLQPIRGLLLFGQSGNGKSLVAQTIGKVLSPLRPVTIVSCPEIIDEFVGSSEKKLNEIFDNPPDIYSRYRDMECGEAMQKAALHIIVMDNFDAFFRPRGGTGWGSKHRGAGDARDSVVNKLLAKMDGIEPFVVPTLVIALTNQQSLIDRALLRPGRFEVQIEVPPPITVEQRVSILDIHLRQMHAKGRLLVRDAPLGSAAFQLSDDNHPTYKQFLTNLANKCNCFSGAMLASVARAAACHALERSVQQFARTPTQKEIATLMNCTVKREDFDVAIKEILDGQGMSDWGHNNEDDKKLHARP